MLARLRVPLGWTGVMKRAAREALADDGFDLAAQQAYYFFFALFPAQLFVIAVASFVPLQSLVDEVVKMLSRFSPKAVIRHHCGGDGRGRIGTAAGSSPSGSW
jgi:uncharacterized BrkB/YihY/UPF0761 family membrane protein